MVERQGGCLCGAVRYRIVGDMRPVVGCHCVQCRKTSGHFVAAASALRENVTVTEGVSWYASSETVRRGFCGTCGSSLFWDGSGSHMSVHAGTLDDPTGLKMAGHIFVGDKGNYYTLGDGLPQADCDDPVLTTQVLP